MKKLDLETYYETVKKQLKDNFRKTTQRTLGIIQFGNDYASNIYIRNKLELAEELGVPTIHHKISYIPQQQQPKCEHQSFPSLPLNSFPFHTPKSDLPIPLQDIKNAFRSVDGIIIQQPYPEQFKEITSILTPENDIDGILPNTRHYSCTAKGISNYLPYITDLKSKNVLIMGRSDLVGKPLAKLLIDQDATVTLAHSKSIIPKETLNNYDIIVLATGKHGVLTSKDIVHLDRTNKSDLIIVDVGINYNEENKMVGDFKIFEEDLQVNDHILYTPVPKGVGLLTKLTLFENLYNIRK